MLKTYIAVAKCGIRAVDLVDQPEFSTVFTDFIKWVESCVREAQDSGTSYYPGFN